MGTRYCRERQAQYELQRAMLSDKTSDHFTTLAGFVINTSRRQDGHLFDSFQTFCKLLNDARWFRRYRLPSLSNSNARRYALIEQPAA